MNQVDAVLLDLSASGLDEVDALAEQCRRLGVVLICALPRELVAKYNVSQASDFFLLPPAPGEVSVRIRQTLIRLDKAEPARNEESLRRGDLYIDLARYEVFHRGNRVLLTFKEYQLLSLLASSPGRVFTRETLLSEVWQYDYYEGTRTVDVHIRRSAQQTGRRRSRPHRDSAQRGLSLQKRGRVAWRRVDSEQEAAALGHRLASRRGTPPRLPAFICFL